MIRRQAGAWRGSRAPATCLLMAASICIPSSSLAPWAYGVTSILLTTPLVTLIVSPPVGRAKRRRRLEACGERAEPCRPDRCTGIDTF